MNISEVPAPHGVVVRIDTAAERIDVWGEPSQIPWDHVFGAIEERGLTQLRTPSLTDVVARQLATKSSLRHLDLTDSSVLSDEGLLALAPMTGLSSLKVGGGKHFTSRGLAVVAHFPHLRELGAAWLPGLRDDGIGKLLAKSSVERLDLMGTDTGDGVVEALEGSRVRQLLTGKRVTDVGLAALARIPSLARPPSSSLDYDILSFGPRGVYALLDGPFTDDGLRALKAAEGLQGLDLFWHARDFTQRGIDALATLPHLTYLGIQGDRCNDAAMESAARLPKLRALVAQDCVATDTGFESLARSKSLEYLWGRRCAHLTGTGFRALQQIETLRGVGVSLARVDDASLALLPDFPSLTEVVPIHAHDGIFRHIGACASLCRLVCMYCPETGDEATEHLADLDLEYYYAGQTQITDRTLQILAGMPHLHEIELYRTEGVSDAGVAAFAEHTVLRRITVTGVPDVTLLGLARLGPDVTVSLDR